jgi:hypothetical protein
LQSRPNLSRGARAGVERSQCGSDCDPRILSRTPSEQSTMPESVPGSMGSGHSAMGNPDRVEIDEWSAVKAGTGRTWNSSCPPPPCRIKIWRVLKVDSLTYIKKVSNLWCIKIKYRILNCRDLARNVSLTRRSEVTQCSIPLLNSALHAKRTSFSIRRRGNVPTSTLARTCRNARSKIFHRRRVSWDENRQQASRGIDP